MFSNRWIPGVLGASALVCMMPSAAQANAVRVAETAQAVTVLIEVNGQADGSGVIISRQNDTYYVMTARHVLEGGTRFELVTPNEQRHPFNPRDAVILEDVDMAMLSFNSSSRYQTAEIEMSPVRLGTTVYVAGWRPTDRGARFDFTPGQISSIDPQLHGYELGYSNVTNQGMSGGPILDSNGRLIGMHGAGEGQTFSIEGEDYRLKEGINWGIPIREFVEGSASRIAARGRDKLGQRDYIGAIADFNQGLFFNSESVEALTGRAYAHFAQGNLRDAISDASAAISNDSSFSVAYLVRGASYALQGNHSRAIEDYTRAIELRSDFAEAHGLRGVSRAELREYRDANIDAARGIELAPDNPFAYFRRSEVRDLVGELDAAAADRRQGEALMASFSPSGYQVALLEGNPRTERMPASLPEPNLATNSPQRDRDDRQATAPPASDRQAAAPTPATSASRSISHLPEARFEIHQTLEAGEAIYSLAVSPDGSWVAGGGEDGTIYLWNSQGNLVTRLTEHSQRVNDLDFSADSSFLTSASSDGTALLWNVGSQNLVRTLRQDENSQSALAVTFSRTGQTIMVARRNGTIELWDSRTGEMRNSLGGHLGGTTGLAVHPNGRLLASSGSDRTVKIWDISSGRVLQTLSGHGATVFSIAFDETGDRLASCDFDAVTKIWDVETGAQIHENSGGWAAHGLAFGSNHLVAVALQTNSAGEGAIALWDAETGNSRGVLLTGVPALRTVRSVRFNSDGLLVSAGEDGLVRIWNVP
ncbi:tetratricopeptide repeat protein [Geitlerinema sp. P-1104]|uniref:trypsin-like peptidase domain-containing protein n=1 Tax=Geitlerinema sp. P-1104 TaxID=2546230 RepID=UPI0014777431|nr:trypsin-like peptidase domain-containing protein [Geitlerinema sp. P-1104]NMG58140.1 tetratricopeptide repeat protein [Geitlerinema sp. P-1104]